LHVSCDNVETLVPTYTARTVSKSEPTVLAVTVPVDDGVKLYQTVLPIGAPTQLGGSPGSVVATIVFCVSVNGSGEAVIAFAKLSFAGAVPHSRLKARLGSPGTLSTLPI
jgi:hypothetical protein